MRRVYFTSNIKKFKGTSTDIWKTVFRKLLFMWSSMPIFSFIGYTLTGLFRKPDNWRQIYKQTSSTFYTSNDVSRRKKYQQVITRLQNGCLITFLKKVQKQAPKVKQQPPKRFCKKGVLKNFANFTEKHLCWRVFLGKVATLQPASFLKRDSNSSAFLWSFQNF